MYLEVFWAILIVSVDFVACCGEFSFIVDVFLDYLEDIVHVGEFPGWKPGVCSDMARPQEGQFLGSLTGSMRGTIGPADF